MKKNIIIWLVALFISIFFIMTILLNNPMSNKYNANNLPRFGQKLWTYNMNKYEWRNHADRDEDDSKGEIVLQYQGTEIGNGVTSYRLLTGNYQVPKEDVLIGENSQEFLIGHKLYSYFPKTFEFYEVVFNGVKFTPKKLSVDDVSQIFKNYQIIKLSEIQKGNYTVRYSKDENKFIILNDNSDEDFYKYYIVPNDSSKLEIEKFSNQFKVTDSVDIKIQRLEGCTKTYPCYEINVK